MSACACHPECHLPCRIEEHGTDEPCLWPDCLTGAEMRALLCELREAGSVTPRGAPKGAGHD